MKKNRLANTDIFVSKVCLGTMTWGEQNTEQQAFEQLDYAVDHGVNFIDTAEIYPVPPRAESCNKTEKIIGRWLQQKGKREKVIIATKMAGPKVPWIRNGDGFVAEHIEQAIDRSLQRLQTDVIDLYQLHWPQRAVPLWGKQNYASKMYDEQAEEQLGNFYIALSKAVQKGKIRCLGLSNESPWGVMKYQQLAKQFNLPQMVSIQNAYSIVRRDFEVGLAEVALAENIGLLAYSPLAGGFLSGKYANNACPKGSRFALFPDLMGYYKNERSTNALQQYQKLAEELAMSLTQLCLAFVNDQPFVSTNIIGATTLSQLAENIGSADIHLTEETLERIDAIFTSYPNPGNF